MEPLPIGKLPPKLLKDLVARLGSSGGRVVVGPGIGMDCAVIEFGDRYLVAKTDPITFTADQIGWYVVHVNANDIATTGARPAWLLVSAMFPAGKTAQGDVEAVFDDVVRACAAIDVKFVGGHTEITAGLDRPILTGTMLGEVARENLVTPRGARPGDVILLTKWVPIEATSILATAFADRLRDLPEDLLRRGRSSITDPGISIVREAVAAADAGGVTAMHDPTEGGLAAGLWEMATAAGVSMLVQADAIPIPETARAICGKLALDPLACIASGALILTADPERSSRVLSAIQQLGVPAVEIGEVRSGAGVQLEADGETEDLHWPEQDALAALF